MDRYYTAITIMIIFCMLVMVLSTKYNIGLTKENKRASAILFGLIMIGVLCEWSGIQLDGKDASLIPPHILVKTTELSLSPFIGLMCGRSFGDAKGGRVIFYLLCGNVVLEIISAFTGMIYYVDAANVYHHGPYYEIYLVSYMLGMIYFVIRGIVVSKQFHGNYGLPILLVVLFVLVCIATQMVNDTIKVDWLAISIAAIMLYKFYGDMLLQIDGLTGLLNHWGYEHAIQEITEKAVILFLDVDKFKAVNDTYGHAVGDQSLQEVAECIRKAYGSYGMCFRYGGDEFCVIMTKYLNQVDKATEEFYQLLQEKRQGSEWMPNVSYGYVEYHPKTDNIQEVMNRADQLMYQYKKEHRTDTTQA